MKFFKKRTEEYPYEDDSEFYNPEYYNPSSQKEGNGFDDEETVEPAETQSTSGVSFTGGASPVALKVIKPKSFEDGPEIADYLASGSTVLLNIELMDRADIKRLLDFLMGATHVLGGSMNRVAKGTFVFAPKSVGVSDLTAEEVSAAEEEAAEDIPSEE